MTLPTSILQGVKDYFVDNAASAGLESGALIGVDFLGPDQVGYSIVTMPGATKEVYLDGGSSRTFPFALQATLSTADDTARIENGGFFEQLSDWLDAQYDADNFPTLPTGKSADKIEALDCGYLYQEGSSGTGVYQILARLSYSQVAP
jgi:hypothetical protein